MAGKIEVTVLGSGTSAGVPMIGCRCAVCRSKDPRDKRSRPSIVVSYGGKSVLIDTSPELRMQCVSNRIEKIDAVVYTHAHADHIFGLDDVRRFNTILDAPLPLYANEDTLTVLQNSFPYAFEAYERLPDTLYRPELLPRLIEGPFKLFGRKWTPVPMIHGRFTVLGFRIGDFAYCTDCNEIPPMSRELLRGLDTLIVDGLRPRPHPTHLSFEQALAIIADVKPRRAFFTHLSHDVKHADLIKMLPRHVRPSYDGMKLKI
jgi:phosphoribosyl 1,2-cyclic phosphate phosphodiesterase